jgi:DNA-binding transcriptional regulator LsrR (DeoR family)
MARLRRGTEVANADDSSLRLRAAWLYHGHRLTQQAVADHLGVSRTTIIRLLDEARDRGEVRVWIDEGEAELIELAVGLERALRLDRAIVVPAMGESGQIARAVGLALGRFLSEAVHDGMTIGVGWGRTLTASLAAFHPPRVSGTRVISLVGGAVETHIANPVEFSWRLASALNAECFLFPAPLVVDSAETKRRLTELCGLSRLYDLLEMLDLAVLGVGEFGPDSTTVARQFITGREHRELLELGCIGEVMCNFLDAEGRTVPHPINSRVISIDLDSVRKSRHLVLASGGANRAKAILAAISRIGCSTLVTDEAAARPLLAFATAEWGGPRSVR